MEVIIEQFLNIEFIFSTLDVLKLLKSTSIEVKFIHDSNIYSILITFEVLNDDKLKEDKRTQF